MTPELRLVFMAADDELTRQLLRADKRARKVPESEREASKGARHIIFRALVCARDARAEATRYERIDPERDKREAEALNRLLADAPIFEEHRAILASLRDRLKGGAQ